MNNKVKGFDNREYAWNLTGYMVRENDTRPRSSYHLRCRGVLRQLFPSAPILEEVLLPGSGSLRLDFYLPRQGIAIEVQGEQHFRMKSNFHENKRAFLESQRRDTNKRRWCELNNIRLVELKYDGTDADWSSAISNC